MKRLIPKQEGTKEKKQKQTTALILLSDEEVKGMNLGRQNEKAFLLEPSHVICLICTNWEVSMNDSPRAVCVMPEARVSH